jgi:hypothetical protein
VRAIGGFLKRATQCEDPARDRCEDTAHPPGMICIYSMFSL